MTRRIPPKLGLWLLERLGRGYHSESLVGDLIERCAQGRGALWAWREIGIAILFAQARRWGPSLGARLARALWWGTTELAIMLSVTVIADQSRNSHSFRSMFTPRFVATLAMVLSIAFVGLRSLLKMHRQQRECNAAAHHLMDP